MGESLDDVKSRIPQKPTLTLKEPSERSLPETTPQELANSSSSGPTEQSPNLLGGSSTALNNELPAMS